MLQRLGYEAVGVGDGGQALAAYSEARNAASPFAAVILDLTLADGQSGLTVLSELLAFDPEARVILASGYLRSVGGEAALPAGVRSTLPKPFRAEDIARAVNEALGPI
jgi:ActR/RegA family two-component response regulator